jgi:hypothetical protein
MVFRRKIGKLGKKKSKYIEKSGDFIFILCSSHTK